jgi:hypothetical protein
MRFFENIFLAKGSCVMRFKIGTQRSWKGAQNKRNAKLQWKKEPEIAM